MNNQEAFDKALAHLRKQRQVSISESGDQCLYRGPNGTMCAVGALIPDNVYHKSFDNPSNSSNAIRDILNEHGDASWAMRLLFKDVSIDLLEQIQSTHDDVSNYSNNEEVMQVIEYNFKEIAKQYDLIYKEQE